MTALITTNAELCTIVILTNSLDILQQDTGITWNNICIHKYKFISNTLTNDNLFHCENPYYVIRKLKLLSGYKLTKGQWATSLI